MIVFLALRYDAAHADIDFDYGSRSVTWLRWREGRIRYKGQWTPFQIVTRGDQLRGIRIAGFEILRHAEEGIHPELVAMARAASMHN